MKNITKLKGWEALKNKGFYPIRFIAFGKVSSIGATNGKITITPHYFKYDKKSYHISGNLDNPVTKKYYQYDFRGVKAEFYEKTTYINGFYTPQQILKVLNVFI